jgi:hypothetical protein
MVRGRRPLRAHLDVPGYARGAAAVRTAAGGPAGP